MARAKKPTQMMFADEVEETKEPVEEPKEEKVEVGVNYIDLPSKGILGYPSHVTFRDILVKDEEVLSSATGENLTRTINSVLKGILNDCEWYEKMSIHDRDYCLIFTHCNNYESVKHVDVTCRACSHKETKKVDLTEIPVDDINQEIPVPFKIPMGDGKELHVVPNTVGHEIEVEKYIASLPEEKQKTASFERLMMIASIDLPMPFKLKVEWVNDNVSRKNLGYIRKYHQHFKFGLHDKVTHECPSCGEVSEVDVPFQITDILFPELPDDFEKLL